jgi:hypothetical protein
MNLKFVAILLTGVLSASAAHAFHFYYTEDRIYVPSVSGRGGCTYLDPDHVYRILGTHTQAKDVEGLVEAGWPSWDVSRSSTDAPGDAAVSVYAAYQHCTGGYVDTAGTQLSFNYISPDSSFADDRFIQIIHYNGASPSIDAGGQPDSVPFYDDESLNQTARNSDHYYFTDSLTRAYNGSNAMAWAEALYLVEVTHPNGGNKIGIRDGAYWGLRTIGNSGSDMVGGWAASTVTLSLNLPRSEQFRRCCSDCPCFA